MSRVSWAVRRCFHSGITAMVRMLCSRSASLMTRTRQSLAMATSILRTVAACWASLESNWSRSSLVTPSTMAATSGPNWLGHVVEGEPGVLHGVVQQGGGDRQGVEAQLGHDGGHRHRVGDVGLARLAELARRGPPRRPLPALAISWRSASDDRGRRAVVGAAARPPAGRRAVAGRRKGAA